MIAGTFRRRGRAGLWLPSHADYAGSLSLVTQPSTSATSGNALAQQPVVRLPRTDSGVTVTCSFASGSGVLTNSTAVTDAAGVATFSGLAITGADGAYTLQFAASATSWSSVQASAATTVSSGAPPSGSASTVTLISHDLASKTGLDRDGNAITVTITGTGFTGTPAVKFDAGGGNEVAATSVVVTNSTTLTCTLPAWAGTPAVGGSAVAVSVAGVVLSPATFEYHHAWDVESVKDNFDSLSNGSYSGGTIPQDVGSGGTVTIGDVGAGFQVPAGRTKSAKLHQPAGQNFAALKYVTSGGAHSNGPLEETHGVYKRWSQYLSDAAITQLTSGNANGSAQQLKLSIDRYDNAGGGSGQNGWGMLGIGTAFANNTHLQFQDDPHTGQTWLYNNLPVMGDGLWPEFIIWMWRDATTSRIKIWVDNKLYVDITQTAAAQLPASPVRVPGIYQMGNVGDSGGNPTANAPGGTETIRHYFGAGYNNTGAAYDTYVAACSLRNGL